MMDSTLALVGDLHGFDALLDRHLAMNGFTRLPPGHADILGERTSIAILADSADGRRAMDRLRRLRQRSDLPCIVVLPADHEDLDRIAALEMGADDWITQGARPREVVAHLRAVLRRMRGAPAQAPAPLWADTPGWLLCPRRRELFDAAGRPRRLTPSEFELLRLLVLADGETLPRDVICQQVFGRRHHPEDRAVDNLVVRLRRKVEPDPQQPRLIKSARQVGYFFTGFPAAREAAAAGDGGRAAYSSLKP